MKYFLSCLIFLASVFPQQSVMGYYPPVPSIQELTDYILDNQISPEDYVVGKFADHDVVFLGEFHKIRHDAELVQRLIPLCYRKGIRILALEFADRKDQPLIDSLLASPTYNETLVRQIAFNNGPDWAYREYLDIYKAAWKLNRSLPEEASPFRIIGINCAGDWSVMRTREDLQNDSLRRVVWQDCPGGERKWAFAILRQVWAGEKVLVYCGIHHAFTRYIQPMVDNNGEFSNFIFQERASRYVWFRLGHRAFTIALHSPWYKAGSNSELKKPVNGVIDSVMLNLGDRFRPVGFDVKGSPFGSLPDSASLYQAGYQDFRLQDYCDGYIFQRPFEQYEMVQFVEDFINASNFSTFQQQTGDPWFREATLEQSKMSLKRQLKREQQVYRGLSSNSGGENPDPD